MSAVLFVAGVLFEVMFVVFVALVVLVALVALVVLVALVALVVLAATCLILQEPHPSELVSKSAGFYP